MQNIKIGKHNIKKTAGLAPMASVADKAYRYMCKKHGASLVVGEMASAKGLCYSDKKTAQLLECTANEYPMAIQLFGSEPEFMAKACKIAEKYQPQFIDINMGCPVQKVISTGSGSALLKTPQLACDIVKACVNSTDIPITVKIRRGFDNNNINAVEMACMLEDAGASAIAVHGRTKQQMYTPGIDIDIIKKVKESVNIPVFGNGDVFDPISAKHMYDYTNCDLVLVARGSYGRPWIFEEIETYLEKGIILPEKDLDEKLDIMLEHISLICDFKGERIAMREARKHAAWYLKGIHNAAKFRNLCASLEKYEDIKNLVSEVKKYN